MGVEQDARHDTPVATAVGVRGGCDSELVAEARQLHAHRPQRQVAGRLEQHRVEQGHVDVLTFAGLLAVPKRRECSHGRMQAGQVVGQERRSLHGLAVRSAVQ